MVKESLPVVLRKLLRLSFKSGKRLFCWSVIWGVQLKSKWIFDQSSIVFDQQAVWKNRLILLKAQWTFFQCLIWKFFYLKKNWLFKRLPLMSCSTQGTAETIRWPCKPIVLSIGRFEGPTFTYWTLGESLIASDQQGSSRKWLILSKAH